MQFPDIKQQLDTLGMSAGTVFAPSNSVRVLHPNTARSFFLTWGATGRRRGLACQLPALITVHANDPLMRRRRWRPSCR